MLATNLFVSIFDLLTLVNDFIFTSLLVKVFDEFSHLVFSFMTSSLNLSLLTLLSIVFTIILIVLFIA